MRLRRQREGSGRFLATILFVDIVGSTELASAIGDAAWQILLGRYYYVDTTKRADAATDGFARLGGKLTDIYWTLGLYDLVAISEFPDDETASAAALQLAAGGNVRTLTMRSFGRDEVKKIVAKAKG